MLRTVREKWNGFWTQAIPYSNSASFLIPITEEPFCTAVSLSQQIFLKLLCASCLARTGHIMVNKTPSWRKKNSIRKFKCYKEIITKTARVDVTSCEQHPGCLRGPSSCVCGGAWSGWHLVGEETVSPSICPSSSHVPMKCPLLDSGEATRGYQLLNHHKGHARPNSSTITLWRPWGIKWSAQLQMKRTPLAWVL